MDLLPYYILWTIAYSLGVIAYFTWIYHIYLRFKRWKFGEHAVGDVIKIWKEVTKKDDGKLIPSYYVTFSFIDDQTDRFLAKLVEKFVNKSFPEHIITTCTEYIGSDSFQFWYGPYEITTEINEESYLEIKDLQEPTKLNIIYDPSNPYNVGISNMGWQTGILHVIFYYGGPIILGLLTWLLAYGTKYTFGSAGFSDDQKREMLYISSGVAVFIGVLFLIIFHCMKLKRYCCCKKELELQIGKGNAIVL